MSDEATPALLGRAACSDFPVFRKRQVGGLAGDWASKFQSGVNAGCALRVRLRGGPMTVICVNNRMNNATQLVCRAATGEPGVLNNIYLFPRSARCGEATPIPVRCGIALSGRGWCLTLSLVSRAESAGPRSAPRPPNRVRRSEDETLERMTGTIQEN